jgi:hypothetical protein
VSGLGRNEHPSPTTRGCQRRDGVWVSIGCRWPGVAALSARLSRNSSLSRNRTFYALLVVGTIAAGLATRSTLSYMPSIFGKYPGDCLWAVMVFWGVGMLFPALSTSRAAGLALLICFVVETMKLLPWDWLSSIRHSTMGHLVLGRAFTWQNYIAYSVGIILASLAEALIARRRASPGTPEHSTRPSRNP